MHKQATLNTTRLGHISVVALSLSVLDLEERNVADTLGIAAFGAVLQMGASHADIHACVKGKRTKPVIGFEN